MRTKRKNCNRQKNKLERKEETNKFHLCSPDDFIIIIIIIVGICTIWWKKCARVPCTQYVRFAHWHWNIYHNKWAFGAWLLLWTRIPNESSKFGLRQSVCFSFRLSLCFCVLFFQIHIYTLLQWKWSGVCVRANYCTHTHMGAHINSGVCVNFGVYSWSWC